MRTGTGPYPVASFYGIRIATGRVVPVRSVCGSAPPARCFHFRPSPHLSVGERRLADVLGVGPLPTAAQACSLPYQAAWKGME